VTTLVAVGAQWGDEGKGKIVDWLAKRAELVVRFPRRETTPGTPSWSTGTARCCTSFRPAC